jgi:3-oxoacid CoA-transferase subunit A
VIRHHSLDHPGLEFPGIRSQRIVLGAPYDKKIEFRTTRSTDVG